MVAHRHDRRGAGRGRCRAGGSPHGADAVPGTMSHTAAGSPGMPSTRQPHHRSAFAITTLRSITGSLGRFLAILSIVALGCGFFAGLVMSGPDMRNAASRWYTGTNLWDLRVISTLGFEQADVDRVSSIDGIQDVMPSRSVDAMADLGSRQGVVRVQSLDVDAAEASTQQGSYVVNSNDASYLNRVQLREGRLPQAAGECVALADAPKSPLAPGDSVRLAKGSTDLDDLLGTTTLTVVGTVSSSNYPYTANFGSTTLGTGEVDQVLMVGPESFKDGAPYTEIYATVAGATNPQSESDAYWDVVGEVKSHVEDAEGSLAQARLADLKADAQSQLDDRRSQLNSVAASILAQPKIATGAEGGAQALVGQLSDAQDQLDEAQRQVDDMEPPDIYVLDRGQSEGAATYHADTERMDHIATVFPLMFFLVAALVALTTMTRMVDDERVEIGTYKALGYSKSRIASKYLLYAGIASGTGAVLGILLLSQVLPLIVIRSYAIIYAVPLLPFPLPCEPLTALAAGGTGVGLTLVATWAAVVSSLRETPALLMLPRAPKAGKRILLERIRPLWARLSFSWKVTFRNLFRYKRRLLMTVIGISGCTALLLVGFGLHDSIWDIIDKQYGPIMHYNTTVGLGADAGEDAIDAVASYLTDDAHASRVARVQQENMQAGSLDYDGSLRVSVVIPQSADELAQEITFRDRASGEGVPMDDDAVLVTEKLASLLHVSAGDAVTLFDQDSVGNAHGEGHVLTVTGVVENYVGNSVYVGRHVWRQVSADEPAFSTVYAQLPGDAVAHQEVAGALHDMVGVDTVTFSDETIETYRSMLSVVDGIVVLLIVFAGLLAFIVLYNLTNINIEERVREIASLKVLGFTRGEVYAYVFREILILALLGDLLGMVLGTWLETFTITAAEVDYVMFGRQIHLPSYLYAFAITMGFAVAIVALMRRKLDRVSMVESLKSVD